PVGMHAFPHPRLYAAAQRRAKVISKATPESDIALAAVIVSFNRRELLKQSLNATLSEPVSGVIVVDNGSTDGSRDWLSQVDDPRLHLEFPHQNIGGAGGFELGFNRALERFNPDWIVCFDDDARPVEGALHEFISCQEVAAFD